MIVNPDKCQAIILTKNKPNDTASRFSIDKDNNSIN